MASTAYEVYPSSPVNPIYGGGFQVGNISGNSPNFGDTGLDQLISTTPGVGRTKIQFKTQTPIYVPSNTVSQFLALGFQVVGTPSGINYNNNPDQGGMTGGGSINSIPPTPINPPGGTSTSSGLLTWISNNLILVLIGAALFIILVKK